MANKTLKMTMRFLLAAVVLCVLLPRSGDIRSNISKRDFIAYWAAGQLLIHHYNPYDASPTLELERQQGFTESKALILRTPPWSLFLMLPLGLVNAYWGWLAMDGAFDCIACDIHAPLLEHVRA